MKTLPVFDIHGKEKGRIELPEAFTEKIRPDIIKRAVLAEASKLRQPYGSDPLAGKRTSAHYHGRRHERWAMINREMARLPRIHGQGFLNFVVRLVPHAVKGRKAHPPKAEKDWELKINKKEHIKALLSAIAATLSKDLVESRGHKIGNVKHVPLVVDDEFQKLSKAKDVLKVFDALGLTDEVKRCERRKIRAGKGKTRGRRYKRKKGILIVVSKDEGIGKAARNIPGVDVVEVSKLKVSDLAPGTQPGRLVVYTKSAVKEIGGIGG